VKVIKLSKRKNNDDWSMRFLDESDLDIVVKEDTTVLRPDDSVLMILLKGVLSRESVALAWSSLKDLRLISQNRSSAAGRENEQIVHKDGTKGKTLNSPKGWAVESGIIGFFERTIRMPYCRPCAWNEKSPEKFERLFPMVKEVDQLFAKHLPERYKSQKEIAKKTCSDYLIPGTSFTTLTVNKNFRTACHKDAGDLPEGFSCLSVIKRGKYKGATLGFPNWGVGADVDTFDLILFDPHEFHGNTQLVSLSKDAVRCSIVYYYRENIQKCEPLANELKRAKSRKPGMPLYD
jgi:hypothetical protein